MSGLQLCPEHGHDKTPLSPAVSVEELYPVDFRLKASARGGPVAKMIGECCNEQILVQHVQQSKAVASQATMCRCFLMTSNWGRRPIRRRPLRICSIEALLWVDALLCFGVFQNCPGSLRASGQAVPYGESEAALMQTFVLFRSVQCLLNHVNMRLLRMQFYLFYFLSPF